MIEVTRLDGTSYYLNPHQIEFIENNPDTTICLVSGKRMIVQESAKKMNEKIIAYYIQIGKVDA